MPDLVAAMSMLCKDKGRNSSQHMPGLFWLLRLPLPVAFRDLSQVPPTFRLWFAIRASLAGAMLDLPNLFPAKVIRTNQTTTKSTS
jgi:hypothetical protein